MSDLNPDEFTDRERYILSYYRSADLSRTRRMMGYDVILGAASVVCLALAIAREEVALGFVAYALIFGRLSYIVVEGGKWSCDFQSIFRKYDAKLRAASERPKDDGGEA